MTWFPRQYAILTVLAVVNALLDQPWACALLLAMMLGSTIIDLRFISREIAAREQQGDGDGEVVGKLTPEEVAAFDLIKADQYRAVKMAEDLSRTYAEFWKGVEKRRGLEGKHLRIKGEELVDIGEET